MIELEKVEAKGSLHEFYRIKMRRIGICGGALGQESLFYKEGQIGPHFLESAYYAWLVEKKEEKLYGVG